MKISDGYPYHLYIGRTPGTVIQSRPMADFSFGFTEGSILLLNGQKHLRSIAEDLISKRVWNRVACLLFNIKFCGILSLL